MNNYEKLTEVSDDIQSQTPIPANVQKLQELFPAVVQDGQVDFDALRQLMGESIAESDERYGLMWPGKNAARLEALEPSTKTLRPCEADSKDWATTKNLYLEGDNLEVLKLLQKSYAGKIKMIYIDPPYNTGKDSFLYRDNFRMSKEEYAKIDQSKTYKENTKKSGRFHSNWLNMMYPRLILARELLSDDGVIFISIDDNEMVNLKEISDEIFGESNFITNLVWKSKSGGANDSNFMAVDHEYILCYAKNAGLISKFLDNNATVTTVYNRSDENGEYALERLDKQNLGYHESLDFPIIGPDNIEYRVIHRNPEVKVARWRWDRDTVRERFQELVFHNGYVYTKNYKKNCGIARSLLIEERFGRTRTGKTDFTDLLFPAAYFSSPKPVKLIHYLADIVQDKNATILDFFSGSATTAHAVMQLNAEDGGSRQFIMVQWPERDEKSEAFKAGYENICEIGKERIRRAGKKIKDAAGENAEKLDTGFRVFKVDESNVIPWDTNPEKFEEQLKKASERGHLQEGRTSEDFFYEVLLKQGIELTQEFEEQEIAGHKVYSLGCGMYYCCFDECIGKETADLAAGIAEWHNEQDPDGKDCVVFVRDSAFDNADVMKGTDARESDARKQSFCATLVQSGIMKVKAF